MKLEKKYDSFSDALSAAKEFITKNGYEFRSDLLNKKEKDSLAFSLSLMRKGKPCDKVAHIKIDNKSDLKLYIEQDTICESIDVKIVDGVEFTCVEVSPKAFYLSPVKGKDYLEMDKGAIMQVLSNYAKYLIENGAISVDIAPGFAVEQFLDKIYATMNPLENPTYTMSNFGTSVSIEKEYLNDVVIDEALTASQRMRRRAIMRQIKAKIAMGRRRAKTRTASMDVLKKRARKAAIKAVKKKLLAGRNYDDLSFSQRQDIDNKVQQRQAVIDRIARKLLPMIRQKEMDRRKNVNTEVPTS